jgi:seryl-tRNA synthetase
MLDRKFATANPDLVRTTLERRQASAEMMASFERFLAVIARRRELSAETDELRATRNSLSKEVGGLLKSGRAADAEPIRHRVQQIAARLDLLEQEKGGLELEENELLLGFPNLLDPRVPTGPDAEHNVEVHRWGQPRQMDFVPRDHVTIGEELGLLDFERAAKLSGTRFAVYKGGLAALERALVNWFIDVATRRNGYTELLVPYIVSRRTMTGTGQLPKFEQDLFKLSAPLNGQDAFLIPTAEVPVTNLHADEILSHEELPIAYCAFTPCFRAEAGSHGRDVRGLTRQHQFHKVELVRLSTPEQGAEQHEALTRHAELLLEELGLPYRRMLLCSGDVGNGSAITYDLEVWLPGQNQYREISSCSWFSDYQARRMSLRFRNAEGKVQIAHTINGSGLAVGRTVIAILENYQQADGSVIIPEVLRPWMGGLASLSKSL